MTNLAAKLSSILPRHSSTKKSADQWRHGDTLELCLPRHWPDCDADVKWCLRANNEIKESGETRDLTKLAGIRKNARVVAWIPASETLLTSTTVPTRSRNKILRALPYALEDQLIGEPEAQHYIYYPASDHRLDVAVISRKTIERWLKLLVDAGLAPALLAPANLGIPLSDNSWTLMYTDTEVWVRTKQFSGFVLPNDKDLSIPVLAAALKEADGKGCAPEKLVIINADDRFQSGELSEFAKLDIKMENGSIWDVLNPAHCRLNLLQGDFIPAKEANPVITRLRPAFIMLALWIVASTSANIWEWVSLNRAHQQTRSEMLRLFKQTFPEAKTIVDPALQMKRKMEELQSGSGAFADNDFLVLLSAATPAIQGAPTEKIRSLKYDEGGLVLSVGLPDYQSMESLKNRLEAVNLDVEVLSANSGSSGVESRLRLRSGKGS